MQKNEVFFSCRRKWEPSPPYKQMFFPLLFPPTMMFFFVFRNLSTQAKFSDSYIFFKCAITGSLSYLGMRGKSLSSSSCFLPRERKKKSYWGKKKEFKMDQDHRWKILASWISQIDLKVCQYWGISSNIEEY